MDNLLRDSNNTPTVYQGDLFAIDTLMAHCLKSTERVLDANQIVELWIKDAILPDDDCTASKLLHLIQTVIIRIDDAIESQINEILHHSHFQQLEASWRGLQYLVDTEASYDEELTVKIKVLNVSWAQVAKDVGRAIEFDQSRLFQRIYSEEFDTPGGEPFGVLLGDYRVSHKSKTHSSLSDVEILREVSQIATAALCPFITGVDSSLFGLDSMTELGFPADYIDIFNQVEYTKWNSLRKLESSRFIGLTMPDILMRQPYLPDDTRREKFVFTENTQDTDKDYLWGNACYAFGSTLIRAFANNGWFADIRGGMHDYGEGGIVRHLEYADSGKALLHMPAKPATNVQIDDYQERELSELGFIPLCSYHSTEVSVFYSNSSLHSPKEFTSEIANTNARLSSMIQYMLCVSRFGHYIKIMGRDKVGSFVSAADCQRVFQNWLNQYTTSSSGSSSVLKARYPLSECKVEVKEQPGKPGYFSCVIHLKPHFQLDQLVSSIRLVTELAVGVGSD